ncbi:MULTISPECIES: MerR family transcriptional regulator [Tissierella]|uniref:MerR HTH family regulatory protein n=1 Tax=Tissierella praeacuta DSM 18095 TaxID=1123404 RepID=A0A1M4SG54_9FIRM|nr:MULTISPECIES: MerR family transcriptional regulator [Tissierella]MBU5254833.1 MerR family transcriptional regulator [Tissierella praeacuta]TCU72731.1 MerR-like DNA binding protein [Tissierella praeacuta]SHE31244.1 MerR HTH family regulatory protein [Tissierella praeacuta DSM 18095]SUP01400.1 Transcriptional regulator, effector-binding domain/component [Tissierella praeacuta]
MLDLNHEYTISEVSELTGYAPHVLRYYEKEFEIDIPRNNSNHRYFTYKEIELIQYIKTLQDKGFTNKQIKLIIQSPEIMVNNHEETDIVAVEDNMFFDTYQLAKEISMTLEEEFFDKLFNHINEGSEKNIKVIEELRDEVAMLRNELNSKERDVLICENAKLKMKIKEKTFENIELNEKLKKIEEKEVGFFKKIFKKK